MGVEVVFSLFHTSTTYVAHDDQEPLKVSLARGDYSESMKSEE